jgi:3',5'-cyclic AMP phosphodiesterase CpdA
MSLRIAAISDIHFGPKAYFRGKLRKLSHQAPALLDCFVKEMNDRLQPDLVLTLGDLIEDESADADAVRYQRCVEELRKLRCPLRFVVGNHDTINLSDDKVRSCWPEQSPLHYRFALMGFEFVVLRTTERRDRDVRLDEAQLLWLKEQLTQCQGPVVVLMHHSAADQSLRGNRWFENAQHLALIENRRDLREVIASSGKVRLVLNGHLHWNDVTIHDNIPYVTVQSLIENLDDDEPGRPARAYAMVELADDGVSVVVGGEENLRFQQRL